MKDDALLDFKEKLQAADTLEEKLADFGGLLGIGKPVTQEVFWGAMEDQTYARNLLVSRGNPPFLNALLANPPAVTIPPVQIKSHNNGDLVKKAAGALVRWAKTGFAFVDDAILERRENACLACPNLVSPENALQKIAASSRTKEEIGGRTGNKVCNLCGCTIARKIRLSSESCPDKTFDEEGLSRWGDKRND